MLRIALNGDSPERHRIRGQWVSPLEVAERTFPGSAGLYRHPIWDLLTGSKLPPLYRMEELVDENLARLHLRRVNPVTSFVATVLCGPGFPGREGDLPCIKAGTELLRNGDPLTAAMIAALQARISYEKFCLLESDAYQSVLPALIGRFEQESAPTSLHGFLFPLVTRRLLRGKWDPISPIYWPFGKLKGADLKRYEEDPQGVELEKRHFDPFQKSEIEPKPGRPIVAPDDRLDWLESVTEALLQEAARLPEASKDKSTLNENDFPAIATAASLWPSHQGWTIRIEPGEIAGIRIEAV